MNATAIQLSVLFLAVVRVALPVFVLVLIGSWVDHKSHPAR